MIISSHLNKKYDANKNVCLRVNYKNYVEPEALVPVKKRRVCRTRSEAKQLALEEFGHGSANVG